MTAHAKTPLPPFARDVLALYARALADVRFPDLDLASLEAAAERVYAAQAAAEARRKALQAAEEEVAAQELGLAALAERALAYARIFATGNAALSAEVVAIARPSAGEPEEPGLARKRGRPRKGAPGAEELFAARSAEDSQAVAH